MRCSKKHRNRFASQNKEAILSSPEFGFCFAKQGGNPLLTESSDFASQNKEAILSSLRVRILLRKTRRIRDKMIDFYGLFSVDAAYVFTGMAAVTLISLIIAIISICKTSSMKKKYKEFMGGSDGTSIEELIKGNLEDVNQIKKLSNKNENNIKDIYEKLEYTFQKIGVVKYDAFHEMGGKLSFALCMLDKLNNGYLVNVMHSNNGCFAYVKEIVDGQSYIELGEEAQKALDAAVAGRTGDAILGKKVNEMLENSGKNK